MVHGEIPPFTPRPPWLGGDLQTLRNRLLPWLLPDLAAWPGQRLRLPLDDGTDDLLLASYHPPATAVGRPLVVLIHGLAGCEDSAYMLNAAAHWLDRGHPVLRLNLRGAGPSRRCCRDLYHAGRSADLRAVLAGLEPGLLAHGLLLVGFSLGANMMLKYLGEEGTGAPVLAAASVSAPIDLQEASQRMLAFRNRPYTRWLLAALKRETLAGDGLEEAERGAVMRARSVYEYDQVFVAPRHGFADAEAYYAACGARNYLSAIRVPTLLIHAPNDPWIPLSPYRAVDWSSNRCLEPRLEARGGHVGFHGRGSKVAWHDRCIARFFEPFSGER